MSEMSVTLKSEVITEADIDRAALEVISEISDCLYEYTTDNDDNMRLVTLGNIAGVIDMARAIKKRCGFNKRNT